MNDKSKDELAGEYQAAKKQYEEWVAAGLNLNMTRGKPGPEQVALSDELGNLPGNEFITPEGTDVRNYGGLDGLPEAKKLFSEVLACQPEEIIVGGNASLTLMADYMQMAWTFGVTPDFTPWGLAGGPVKFLCPVPGYDRHFTICERLGIEMIPVAMNADGPDMDQVRREAKDPRVKGIWCVPCYSNPTGTVYSAEVARELATMEAAPDFRIMWDNAYIVHHLGQPVENFPDILELCRQADHEDRVVQFGSTSKITFAGAGVGFLATSQRNREAILRYAQFRTIGPDKVNQWRHVQFLKDRAGVEAHMNKHAAIIAPKFEKVLSILDAELGGWDQVSWTRPRGGYFISFTALEGTASRVVELAGEAGVKLTPAGATFPYKKDPANSNIRLAPTFPGLEEIEKATRIFVVCVKLAILEKFAGA